MNFYLTTTREEGTCPTSGYLSTFWLYMQPAVLMISFKNIQKLMADEDCNCVGSWIYMNLLLVKITITML